MTEAPEATGTVAAGQEVLRELVVDLLRSVFDPEIPVNVYDLGLVHGIGVDAAGKVTVRMTLTSPACPVAGSLPGEVAAKLRCLPGVFDVAVDLVWDPPWGPDRMGEAARLALGLM